MVVLLMSSVKPPVEITRPSFGAVSWRSTGNGLRIREGPLPWYNVSTKERRLPAALAFLGDGLEPERGIRSLAFGRNRRGVTLDATTEAGLKQAKC